MLHLGWIAIVIFVAWRIGFAIVRRNRRGP
jgi:hypothetical protein